MFAISHFCRHLLAAPSIHHGTPAKRPVARLRVAVGWSWAVV